MALRTPTPMPCFTVVVAVYDHVVRLMVENLRDFSYTIVIYIPHGRVIVNDIMLGRVYLLPIPGKVSARHYQPPPVRPALELDAGTDKPSQSSPRIGVKLIRDVG